MKIQDIDKKLQEQVPSLAMPTAGSPTSNGITGGTTNQTQPSVGAPQAGAGQQVDPATAALAMKQNQQQKKQIQDQIRATEKQLQNLRKQLAQIR